MLLIDEDILEFASIYSLSVRQNAKQFDLNSSKDIKLGDIGLQIYPEHARAAFTSPVKKLFC